MEAQRGRVRRAVVRDPPRLIVLEGLQPPQDLADRHLARVGDRQRLFDALRPVQVDRQISLEPEDEGTLRFGQFELIAASGAPAAEQQVGLAGREVEAGGRAELPVAEAERDRRARRWRHDDSQAQVLAVDEAPGRSTRGRRVGIEGDIPRELLSDQAGGLNGRSVGVPVAGEGEQGQGGAGLRLGRGAHEQVAAGFPGRGRAALDRHQGVRIQVAEQSPECGQVDLAGRSVDAERDAVQIGVEFLPVEAANQTVIGGKRLGDDEGIGLCAGDRHRGTLQGEGVLLDLYGFVLKRHRPDDLEEGAGRRGPREVGEPLQLRRQFVAAVGRRRGLGEANRVPRHGAAVAQPRRRLGRRINPGLIHEIDRPLDHQKCLLRHLRQGVQGFGHPIRIVGGHADAWVARQLPGHWQGASKQED